MKQLLRTYGKSVVVSPLLVGLAVSATLAQAQEHQIMEAYVFKGRLNSEATNYDEGQVVRGVWKVIEIFPDIPQDPPDRLINYWYYEGYSIQVGDYQYGANKNYVRERPIELIRSRKVNSNLLLAEANLLEGEGISVNPSEAFDYRIDEDGNRDYGLRPSFKVKVLSLTSRAIPEMPIIANRAGVGPLPGTRTEDSKVDAQIVNEDGESLGIAGGSYWGNSALLWPLSTFTVEYGIYPYKIPASSFYLQIADLDGVVRLRVPITTGVGCESCDTGACSLGASIGSVDVNIGLGGGEVNGAPQSFSNALRFYQEGITNEGVNSLTTTASNVIRSSGGQIQSLESGDQIARVEVLGAAEGSSYQDPNRFRIRVSSDKSDLDGSVYREVIIENVLSSQDSALQLKVTETLHGRTTVTAYENTQPAENVERWVLETGNGLRREIRTTTETENDRIERTVVQERKSSGGYDTVSDEETTTRLFAIGGKVIKSVVNPGGAHEQTTSSTYYEEGEESGVNGFSSTIGNGLLKQKVLPTGDVETHYYYDLPEDDFYDRCHVVLSSFAGQANAREVTTCSMMGIGSSSGLSLIAREVVERVNGNVVAKSEVLTEVSSLNSLRDAMTTETRVYSDDDTYETSYTITNPFSTTVINPDGTGSFTTIAKDQVNDVTVTTSSEGYWSNPTSRNAQLVLLSKTVTTTNAEGETIESESFAYGDDGSEHIASRRVATEYDDFGRVTQYTYFPGSVGGEQYITENEYGCCGLLRSTDRSGIPTYFTRDALDRVTKTNRLGITTETVYDGLTTSTHRYPEVVSGGLLAASQAAPGNEVSRTTRNILGDTISNWSRTAMDGSLLETTTETSYNLGNGIGRRVVSTYPQTADDQGELAQSISEYYTDGNVFRQTGNMGANSQYSYASNASGMVTTTSLLAEDGETSREPVTTVADWAGRAIRMEYASDADGDGSNDFSSSEYTADGKLVKTVDVMGVVTLFEYNIKGQLYRRATDINNNGSIDIGTDRVVETNTEVTVGNAPRAGSVRRTTTQVYTNNIITTNRSEQSLDGLSTWTANYPGTDYETVSKSVTQYTGEGSWNSLFIIPDGWSNRSVYSGGRLQSTVYLDRRAREVYRQTFEYDAYNRNISVTDSRFPASSSMTYVSDLVDVEKTTTDPASQVTTYSYDQRNRRISEDAPDTVDNAGNTVANITTSQYFPDGQVREISGDQTYRRSYTYDYARRVKTQTTYGTATAVTRWDYDTDRGWLIQKRYDSPAEGVGSGPSYTYMPNGSLKTRTWARLVNGNPLVTTYTYGTATGSSADDLDAVSYSDQSQGYVVNQRDLLGRVELLTDASGESSFEYTAHGALANNEMNGNGPLAGLALEYKYDNKGRPESLDALHDDEVFHGVKYSYGDAGRLAAVSNDHAQVGYSYDPVKQTMAQQAFQTFSGDNAQTLVQNTRSYDHLNRLESTSYHSTQHAAGGAKALAHHGYTYNALSQRTRAELLDGSYWDYGYNNRGELVKAKHKDKAGAELTGQQFGYNYDAMGNRLGASDGTSDTAMANTYTPDALNQYSSIMTSPVKYVTGTAPAASAVTLNGDATQRQGDYFSGILNADNAAPLWQQATVSDGSQTTAGDVYIPAASVAPEYDADGNLRNDGRWIYTWNGENRLIEMEPTAAALSAGMPYAKLRFRYDYQGRRILREQFNTAGSVGPDSTIHYLYDGWNCIAELDESNTALRKYVWGTDLSGSMQGAGGVGGLLWVEDEASLEKHFYGYDGNGNVVLTSDMTTGSISSEYSYSPFGETIKATGSYADENRYRFSTKPQDEVSGLLYYGYRYYDPVTGRWLSKDPIEEGGGVNLYGFVGNDGINHYDYLGNYTLDDARNSLKKRKIIKKKRAGRRNVHSNQQVYDEWYRLEKTRGSWWMELPKCPQKICLKRGLGRNSNLKSAINPDKTKWVQPGSPSRAEENLHPGTRWTMRSKPDGAGHANQCTYDEKGKLLTNPPASGTVDWHKSGTPKHYEHDVAPVYLANSLDGGGSMGVVRSMLFNGPKIQSPPGSNLNKYFEVRPLWAEN